MFIFLVYGDHRDLHVTDTLFPYTTLCRSVRPRRQPRERICLRCPPELVRLAGGGQARQHHARRIQIGRAHAELQSLMRISYAVFCLKKNTSSYTMKQYHIPNERLRRRDIRYALMSYTSHYGKITSHS